MQADFSVVSTVVAIFSLSEVWAHSWQKPLAEKLPGYTIIGSFKRQKTIINYHVKFVQSAW